ncbi:MAG: hypothetical protein ACI861_000671 [Paracoccaceae bacterium]|jgi:hypothetical protein
MPFISVVSIEQTLIDGVQTDADATENTLTNGSILRIPSTVTHERWEFSDDDDWLGDDYAPMDEDGHTNPNNDLTKDTSGQTVDGVRYHIDYEIIVEDADGNQYSIYVLEEDGNTSGAEAGGDGDVFNDQQWLIFDKDNPPPLDADLTIVSSVVQGAKLRYDEFVACFAEGTEIQMSLGKKMVEGILLGDMVRCADGQVREVRWIGRKNLASQDIAARPQLRPIKIAKDAFGKDLPNRELLVSPQHRILIGGQQTELWFGEPEMLVAAKHLVNGSTITVDEGAKAVCYYHILFTDHQIVYSNGLKTESFFPGLGTLKGLEHGARKELLEIFPELREGPQIYGPIARPVVNANEAHVLRY